LYFLFIRPIQQQMQDVWFQTTDLKVSFHKNIFIMHLSGLNIVHDHGKLMKIEN
jgi:hypothetical protein